LIKHLTYIHDDSDVLSVVDVLPEVLPDSVELAPLVVAFPVDVEASPVVEPVSWLLNFLLIYL
jgi:hypothetical protein